MGHCAAEPAQPLGAGSHGRGQTGISRVREVNTPLHAERASARDSTVLG